MNRYVEAETVSHAWLGVCDALLDNSEHAMNHVLIRIASPLPEDSTIRAAADSFLASVPENQEINEVRNTIFPADIAADYAEPSDLAEAYLEHYPFLKKLGKGSARGTYFGRMCAYPRENGELGRQLESTVRKLRDARDGARMTSRYELNIYSEHYDGAMRMGFPCMAHLAFHLDGDRLDCMATYRNHDVIRKGYGNYLGLAELQAYVAAAAGFRPGELSVLAGHAYFTLSSSLRAALSALVGGHRA